LWGWDQEDGGLRPAQANSSKNPHLQNNQSQMDWRCGSSCRAPALQVWSSNLNLQSSQKKTGWGRRIVSPRANRATWQELFSKIKNKQINKCHQALVAHICNPSYSGGRDQEDHSSKPAQANSSWDPISKTPITKRAGRVAQGEGLVISLIYSNITSWLRERGGTFDKWQEERSVALSSLSQHKWSSDGLVFMRTSMGQCWVTMEREKRQEEGTKQGKDKEGGGCPLDVWTSEAEPRAWKSTLAWEATPWFSICEIRTATVSSPHKAVLETPKEDHTGPFGDPLIWSSNLAECMVLPYPDMAVSSHLPASKCLVGLQN
jgi:hypothetical protein